MSRHYVKPPLPLPGRKDHKGPHAIAPRTRTGVRAGISRRSLGARWLRALHSGLHKAFRAACWAALAFGIASAIYLTLRRSGDLRTVSWIPYPVALWADYHGRSRNLVAYAILALPVLVLFDDRKTQLSWMVALGVLGTALEYGQLFIPTRWFEWQDIALSLAGLATSWVAVEGYRLIFRRLSARSRARRPLLR
jgi:hypothetical protein